MFLSDDSFPFGASLPLFGGFSSLNMAGHSNPPPKEPFKNKGNQWIRPDHHYSYLVSTHFFNFPPLLGVSWSNDDGKAYVFQRWVGSTQPPPSLKFLGTSSLSEASTLMMELQDLSLSLVLSQKTGEKKTTNREKGKSLKLTVIYMFFLKNCGDTCFFGVNQAAIFWRGIKIILTTDDYFEWFLPKICVVSCLGW